jgi:DNA transformation protein and related proteins
MDMKTSPAFGDHCLDLFSGLGRVVARVMFGGHGFFIGRAMFAIGDAEEWQLWLKVDEDTRARFEAAGGEAFTYASKGRMVTLSFFTPPEDAMEDGERMLPWARLALEAAERAVAKRSRGARPPRGARSDAKKRKASASGAGNAVRVRAERGGTRGGERGGRTLRQRG